MLEARAFEPDFLGRLDRPGCLALSVRAPCGWTAHPRPRPGHRYRGGKFQDYTEATISASSTGTRLPASTICYSHLSRRAAGRSDHAGRRERLDGGAGARRQARLCAVPGLGARLCCDGRKRPGADGRARGDRGGPRLNRRAFTGGVSPITSLTRSSPARGRGDTRLAAAVTELLSERRPPGS